MDSRHTALRTPSPICICTADFLQIQGEGIPVLKRNINNHVIATRTTR